MNDMLYTLFINEAKPALERHSSSGGGPGSSGIITVTELPTENIQTGSFYRLLTATLVQAGVRLRETTTCYCVDGLPKTGKPVTIADTGTIVAYYNIQDGKIYGYIDDALSAGLGIPGGWYDEQLFTYFSVTYGGVTMDISKYKDDASIYLLIELHTYFYNDGWYQTSMGYETPPKFDIQWDGDMTDHFVFDMSVIGYNPGHYMVKVSDQVVFDGVLGSTIEYQNGDGTKSYAEDINNNIDETTFPGAFTVTDGVMVVYSGDELAAGLGVPAGVITNGVYFLMVADLMYTSRFTGSSDIIKIDQKFIGDLPSGGTNVDLSEYAKKSDLSGYAKTSDLSAYAKASNLSAYAKASDVTALETQIGDISTALDELHAYAQTKVSGGEEA